MAKKKSNSAKSSKKVSKASVVKKESMVSKVEVKKPLDQEKLSRTVGTVFIALGILLISYGIFSFVRFNRNPELDESFDSPSLSGTSVLTNSEDLVVRGIADGYDTVIVYLEGEEIARTRVTDDSTYEYSHSIEGEGIYAVSVAGVRGFPKRYMSTQSEVRLVEIDWTPPELVDITYPVEVGTETFTLVGVVEANASVTLRRGIDKYEGECDEDGQFVLEGILLEEGPNVFTLEISDVAGNMVEIEEKIRVIYSLESDVNGNAVMDSLPVASGELAEAMRIIRENNLMVLFGLLAVISLMVSSSFVLIKYKGKN